MKEILFRAQRKDNGEWTEGYAFELQPGQYMICDRKQYDRPSTLPVWEFFRYCSHEVIPETICQYTGLTDKNGNRIWENDIVDTYEESSKEHLINVVKFENGCFKVFKKHYLPMYLDAYSERDLITIGNIFENPELLKGE